MDIPWRRWGLFAAQGSWGVTSQAMRADRRNAPPGLNRLLARVGRFNDYHGSMIVPREGVQMVQRKPPGRRSDYVAFHAMTTRFTDNDALGHMNNAVHYRLFDTAVCHWLAKKGLLDLQAPVVAMVVESGCRYFGELAFPDTIVAGLRIARIGRSSVVHEIGLFREDEQTARAEGFIVHVYVDRATGRTAAIAPGMHAILRELHR